MPTFITQSRGATTSRKLVPPSGPGLSTQISSRVGLGPDYAVHRAIDAQNGRQRGMGAPLNQVQGDPGTPTLLSDAFLVDGGVDRIIIEGWSSAPGVLYLETQSATGTWADDSETLLAGETVRGIATTVAGERKYRIRIEFPGGFPQRAEFWTQARP